MLTIYQASAGSGKTFNLAYEYIKLLLGRKTEQGRYLLRNQGRFHHRAILAITFTNKATDEMKRRIVRELALLSHAPLTDGEQSKYEPMLLDEFGCTPDDLAEASRKALVELLNDFTFFNVSTIDAFFQTVLRTFAREAELSGNFEVELSDTYAISTAVDTLLASVRGTAPATDAGESLKPLSPSEPHDGSPAVIQGWIVRFMLSEMRAGRAFNLFNRTSRIHEAIIGFITRLSNETLKRRYDEMADYLADPGRVVRLDEALAARLDALDSRRRDTCRTLVTALAARGLLDKYLKAHVLNPLRKYADGSRPDKLSATLRKAIDDPAGQSYLKGATPDPALHALLCDALAAVADAAAMEPTLRATRANLFALGILGSVFSIMSRFRADNNLILLSDTNGLLSDIISTDETPFIYERLGMQLRHFLIDEFQDTSRLQWGNLRPLLHESESRGNYNLMIGDAKQSIYRFRNADPTLITDVVPRDFPLRVPDGDLRQENTNWRSRRTVVEFNNLFFKALSALLPHDGSDVGHLPELYSNTVQYPHHRDRSGYIEINFISDNSDSSDNSDNSDPSDNPSPLRYPYLGPLLSSLHSRGYRWRDMAVLVATNNDGTAAIDSLVAYNATLAEGETPVEFISEESLRVSSAKSVRTVISALQALDNNRDPKKIFNFYTMQHPEMDSAQILARWFPGGRMIPGAPSPLTEMLEGMQTVALPALVEEIIQTFVSHELRRSEAMFLAAFEDLVMAFCEGHAADVSSFLEWWRVKGEKTPVSSPEGADAVQVMTVHKSKGLEFRCVILPDANQALRSSGRRGEWRWVRPSPQLDPQHTLPDFLPVITDSSLEGTDHENELREFHDLYTMDKVNQYYVAFTRAVDELYVFTSLDKGKGDSRRQTRELGKEYKLGQCLREVFVPDDGTLCLPDDDGADADMLLPPGLVRVERDGDRILRVAVGAPCADVAPEGNGDAQGAETFDIDEYSVSRVRFDIKYRSAGRLPAEKEGDGEEEDPEELDRDPRSEGNLMHSVLENVAVASDLPRAVRILETKGLLTRRAAMETEAFLREAISGAEVRGWFNGEWRVLNERDILIHGQRNLRPDRVMVSADGKRAVVVDYKFGKRPEGNVHRRQVRGYVDAVLAGGLAAEAQGYVWYVREGVVERVADS